MIDQAKHIEQLKADAEYWKGCYSQLLKQVNKTLEAQELAKKQHWNQKLRVDVFREESELKKIINPKKASQATIQWLEQ